MKIYLHKLTALKIIAVFLTVIEISGKVFIKKPGTFYYSIGCKKVSPDTSISENEASNSPQIRLLHKEADWKIGFFFASCAVFADRLVGKYRTLVAYNMFSRLEVHKYWSKKIFNCPELNSFRIDMHYLLEGKLPKLLEYAYCLNVANSAFWQVLLFSKGRFPCF